jgi:hypothetical protein
VSRDAGLIDTTRNPVLLKRYLSVLAASSATIPNHRSLYQAAGIDRKTAVAYDGLLEGAVVQQTFPAWFTNRLKRIAKLPKRYLTDTALVAALVGADVQAAMRDVHLAGRLLDTFVAAQLRPELTVSSCRPTLYHLRTEHGHEEIDILAEVQGGGLVAFEVKTGSFDKHDAKHLRWLRDRIDDRFIAGIVLHTGRFKVEIDDRIWAMPVCSLWSSG